MAGPKSANPHPAAWAISNRSLLQANRMIADGTDTGANDDESAPIDQPQPGKGHL